MRPARTLTTLFAGLALTSLAAPAALAEDFVTLGTYDSSLAPYLTTRDVGRGLAQSFVASATGEIDGIQIHVGIKPNGDPSLFANITWSFHEFQSGADPRGATLASGSFLVSNGDVQGAQFKFLQFASSVPVTLGTQYILFVGSGIPPTAQAGGAAANNPNLYWYAGNSLNSDSYAPGVGYEMLSATTFGSVSPATDFRLDTVIWLPPACVPEAAFCDAGQQGTVFYVDLNPAPNRLKCVSSDGTDLTCTVEQAAGNQFTLTSTAFQDFGSIPASPYTCNGGSYPAGTSPPLSWSNVPAGTQSLAIVMFDIDATGSSGSPWVHWVMTNIPPTVTGIAAGEIPTGAIVGYEEMGQQQYAGPCPPSGTGVHNYHFEVLAYPYPLPPFPLTVQQLFNDYAPLDMTELTGTVNGN